MGQRSPGACLPGMRENLEIYNLRMIALAERFGLAWVNVFDAETNPLMEVGHLVRKDGVKSKSICLLDLASSEVAKQTIVPILKELLGHEAEGSGI